MTTEILSPLPKQKFFDNNGLPLVGGKLFTYSAGTTTKLATYIDSTGGTPNTNPIILDFRGEANVWIPPNIAYKYILAPSTDTDPPTNPIWTVDNIISSQLITLYGGVDTGTANAYILNFAAPYTSLTDGIVIYWIPSNTNTGPSTINVNGLGPVPIVNQDGSALYFGQLVANQFAQIAYKGGQFLLIAFGLLPTVNTQNANYTFALTDSNKIVLHSDGNSWTYRVPTDAVVPFPVGTTIQIINQSGTVLTITPNATVSLYPFGAGSLTSSGFNLGPATATFITKTAANTWEQITLTSVTYAIGTFTGTLTGMTATITGTINYKILANQVTLYSTANVTGTSNTTAMTMTGLPAVVAPTNNSNVVSVSMMDNSINKMAWAYVIGGGNSITFGFGPDGSATGWTNSGTKGLVAGWTVTYNI